MWYCLLCCANWFLLKKSVDKTLVCDYSNESYRAGLYVVLFIMLYKLRQFYFLSLQTKPQGVTIKMKAIEQYFQVVLFIMLLKVVLTF